MCDLKIGLDIRHYLDLIFHCPRLLTSVDCWVVWRVWECIKYFQFSVRGVLRNVVRGTMGSVTRIPMTFLVIEKIKVMREDRIRFKIEDLA